MKRSPLSLIAPICLLAFLSCARAIADDVDRLIHAALMLDPHPSVGGVLYRNNCASCHGLKGEGNLKGMPTLARQRTAYLVKQSAEFWVKDRKGGMMHYSIAGKEMREPQSWIDVAAYLNSLPKPSPVQHGNGENLERGKTVFQERCVACHESDGRGDDDGFVPSLRNQHYSYLVDQMRAFASGKRHNVEPELNRFFASLNKKDQSAVADYVSRRSYDALGQ